MREVPDPRLFGDIETFLQRDLVPTPCQGALRVAPTCLSGGSWQRPFIFCSEKTKLQHPPREAGAEL